MLKFCRLYSTFYDGWSTFMKLKNVNFNSKKKLPFNKNNLKSMEKKKLVPEGYFTDADYFKIRYQATEYLKASGENPYPHKFHATISLQDFNKHYSYLKSGQILKDNVLSLAGRVISKRKSGAKLIFYDLKLEGEVLQIISDSAFYPNEDEFLETNRKIRRGDVIGCKGYPYRSKMGELSLKTTYIQTLAPCLHKFPHPYFGLLDSDKKFHPKYLEVIVNDSVRHRLITRIKMSKCIRDFFYKLKFHEESTPFLINCNGDIRQFITHHNQFNMNLGLRTSINSYLLQLIVGGFNQIFEIGPLFRNVNIDKTRYVELIFCEFYMAHKDLNYLMQIIETLLSQMVKSLIGSYTIKCYLDDDESDACEIDFTPPFKKVKMWQALEDNIGIKLPDPDTLHSDESNRVLFNVCTKCGIESHPSSSNTELLKKLSEHFLQNNFIQPTFLCEHPEKVSPLAKLHPGTPGLTERFELFVKKMKIVDCCTILNDPLELRRRYEILMQDKVVWDDETQQIDEAVIKAVEYGLPPTVGGGISIDRLAMILTNTSNIQDVICFPVIKS